MDGFSSKTSINSIADISAKSYTDGVLSALNGKYDLPEEVNVIIKELLYNSYKDRMNTCAGIFAGICNKISGNEKDSISNRSGDQC